MKPKVIAVDFDGTLSNGVWSSDLSECTYNFNEGLIKELNEARRILGCRIVLWTCRGGVHLQDAVIKCKEHGLVFDAINSNVVETYEWFKDHSSPKIYADLYLDDKAIVPLLDGDPKIKAEILLDILRKFIAKGILELHK